MVTVEEYSFAILITFMMIIVFASISSAADQKLKAEGAWYNLSLYSIVSR